MLSVVLVIGARIGFLRSCADARAVLWYGGAPVISSRKRNLKAFSHSQDKGLQPLVFLSAFIQWVNKCCVLCNLSAQNGLATTHLADCRS